MPKRRRKKFDGETKGLFIYWNKDFSDFFACQKSRHEEKLRKSRMKDYLTSEENGHACKHVYRFGMMNSLDQANWKQCDISIDGWNHTRKWKIEYNSKNFCQAYHNNDSSDKK